MACSDILAGGVFDVIIIDRTDTLESNLFEWLKKSTFEQVKKEVDAGLDVFDIFGASFDGESFREWKEQVDTGVITAITKDQSFKVVSRTASKPILDAWLTCEGQGQGRGLIDSVDPVRGGDQQDFLYSARYIPNAADDLPPTVTSFQIGNGELAPGGGINVGDVVGFGGVSTLIRRTASGRLRPVSSGVEEREIWGPVSITLNTTKGSVIEVVPPVTETIFVPVPPQPQLLDFKYQLSGSMSKDAGETGWFSHPNVFQLPPNSWIDTNRGGNISNADISHIQPPRGFDIYFHDYPATLKRSVFAVSINVVDGLVNAYVTLMGHDKVGRERYRATLTVYYAMPG